MRKRLAIASLFLLGLMAADSPTASIGQPAPGFSLPDLNGKTVSLSDFKGQTVVLEWVNPECPFVQRHYKLHTMTDLIKKYPNVTWLSIATGHTADADSLKSFASENDLSHPILLDKDGTVGHAYGATNTPEMYIIDKSGNLVYEGGIDSQASADSNDPVHADTDKYVDDALTALQSGQPIAHPQTKAYGCFVKYPN
ncbi:MAG TPA: redoxin domain-containing protein [Tepidisphaeraceae bacterium]|jgi:peroxiredoxin